VSSELAESLRGVTRLLEERRTQWESERSSHVVDGGGDAQRLEHDRLRDLEGYQGMDARRVLERRTQSLIMRKG
jgi:hypothetical protein